MEIRNKSIVQYISFFLIALTMLCSMVRCKSESKSKVYYFDSVNGSNSNLGVEESKAFQNLEKLKELKLNPGDKVLLKRGDTFSGTMDINAQGKHDARIIVDAYGEGSAPIIMGTDTSMYAVRILNSDYVTLQNIEIVNTGKERLAGRTGLKIECKEYGISHNLHINNIKVRDINGSLVKQEGGGSGILIQNRGAQIPSAFDSLTIENCHILRCERNGMIWSADYRRDTWFPSTNTVVRYNLIEEVPGDGIVPIGCDKTLIEHNVMRNCPQMLPMTEAAAGIWPWSCDNTIIQFNEVSDHKAPWDAQGFDSDYNCNNTLIQYNLSHNNDGGFILICNSGESTDPKYNVGNNGSVVKYNISINDAIRTQKTRIGTFSPSIHVAGPTRNTNIANNIIHVVAKPSGEVDRTLVMLDSWEGYADETNFANNIFYTEENSKIDITKSTKTVFEGNYFLGKYKNVSFDKEAKNVNTRYTNIINTDKADMYGLSAFISTKKCARMDVRFVNKEAVHALFADEQ